MAYCPHCKRDGMANAHIDRCPDNPPVHEAIRAALTSRQDSRYAIGSTHYGIIAKAHGVPSETTLVVHYGSWRAAVDAFGLLQASSRPRTKLELAERKQDTVPCPYCNRQLGIGSRLNQHMASCPQQPDAMDLVRALIEDTPGIGDSSEDYRRAAAVYMVRRPEGAPAAPTVSALKKHFGGWVEMLHTMGLMTLEEAIDAKTTADNARYRAAWKEHHDAELESWGLPVASVQKPTPIVRVLPDGRKATMIR